MDRLLARWVERLEAGPAPSAPAAQTAPAAPNTAKAPARTDESPLAGVRVRGGSVVFAGAPVERLELRLGPEGPEHAGSVAVRGPLSSFVAAAQKAGLDEAQARALEFVAAWFGDAFDAARAREQGEHLITWGFQRFGGDALARCLEAWKRRDAESFQARLGQYGIDVTRGGEGESAPEITVVDPESSEVVSGRAAEAVLASEVRLFSVLARAGRHPAAQAAQIEIAVASVLPALRVEMSGDTRAPRDLGAAVRAPCTLAALFYVTLVFELRGARLMAQVAGADPAGWEGDGWVQRLAARLERSSHAEHARALRRILASPELR